MARKRLSTRTGTNTRYTLTDAERYALCCYCVFDTTKLDVFKLAHPEMVGTKNVIKNRSEEFFASSDVTNFIHEYREYLEEVDYESKNAHKPQTSAHEDREERKRKALEMLADDLIDQIFALRAGGQEVDRETIMKMVDRIGWLGDEEVKQEAPRRYLPETCSQCRYKKWIEENCESQDNNE